MKGEYKNTNPILSERMSYNCTNNGNAFCNIKPVNSFLNLSSQFFLPFSDTNKNVKLKFYISINLPAQWAVSITSVLNRKNGFANGKIGAKVAVA